MEPLPGLSLQPSPLMVVIGAGFLLVTLVVGLKAWQRSAYRRATGLLELVRLLLMALVVFTLWQPERLQRQAPDEVPTLIILADESASMDTRDVDRLAEGGGLLVSRAEAIKPLMEESAWPGNATGREGAAAWKILFERFSSRLDSPDQGTDLNEALSQMVEHGRALKGVVLLSDGDWNVGRSPIEAATRLRLKGVPVFAVGVGSRVPLPDLELARMDAPTFGVVGKPLRIPFRVSSQVGQERELRVELSVDGKMEASQFVSVPAMGQAEGSLTWHPSEVGDFSLSLSFPSDELDRVPENNQMEAPISIRQEQLKVLVVESLPRWEYRYLRNALERDPGVDVTCLLFHPRLPKVGGGRRYVESFPSASALNQYDVVFLGDVGLKPKQLSLENAIDLRQLVSSQAAGLVLIPGRNGHQQSLISSPLEDLFPVVMNASQPRGVGSADRGHFSLTEMGRRSLLTRLADADQANAEVWRRLPGFHWYGAVDRAKVGSEVLVVHEQATTSTGRIPLIVTKTFGAGKVLYMGTDSAWLWREGVEDRYHYRFWGQVARWMAYQRQKAQGKSIRLFCSPDRPRVGDQVSVNANVLDPLGTFLEEGTVLVRVVTPGGVSESIHLQPGQGDARGLFAGTFFPQEPGPHRVIASSVETRAVLETDLFVQGDHRERLGGLVRFDVLEEIASVTRGKVFGVGEVRNLFDHLEALPDPESVVHRTRIWAHPLWCGFLVILMGGFWIGRKVAGTI